MVSDRWANITIYCLACTLWGVQARAHVGDLIGGIDLVTPEAALPSAIETNYGLLLERGEGYAWVCHEAVTAPGAIRSPRYRRSAEGTWLAVVPEVAQGRGGRTLFRSPDGCSWDDVSGLPEGAQVAQARFDPDDPTLAHVVTATAGGPNGVWRSTDGGSSWSEDLPPQEGRLFHSVSTGADGLLATATDLGGTRGFLWRRAETGEWSEQELTLAPDTQSAEIRVVERSPEQLWLVIDPIGGDALLYSTDAGQTFAPVDPGEGNVSDTALIGDTFWFIRDGRVLLPVTGGVVGPEAPGFSPSTGLYGDADGLWMPEQSYITGALLSFSGDDGQTFETLAYPDDIEATLDCPAGSEVASICAPLWGKLLPRIRGFDAPPIDTAIDTGLDRPRETEPDPVEPRCGCQSSGGGLWLLGALLLARRRSRRARP